MRVPLLLSLAAATILSGLSGIAPANAQDRYRERPPVVVSPDLSAPWVMQLRQPPRALVRQAPRQVYRQQQQRPVQRYAAPGQVIVQGQAQQRIYRTRDGALITTATTAALPRAAAAVAKPQMNPIYLPQQVSYATDEKPGTIVIDTASKFLYFVEGNGQATRYGVGVGKEGMAWSGIEYVKNKREWPSWHPPAEMRERELREKGRVLPVKMEGGPANPLGARALYLGDTLYRIHGTNAPWTIGTSNSSGCIRMRNEDVVQLYDRVQMGAKVIVQ